LAHEVGVAELRALALPNRRDHLVVEHHLAQILHIEQGVVIGLEGDSDVDVTDTIPTYHDPIRRRAQECTSESLAFEGSPGYLGDHPLTQRDVSHHIGRLAEVASHRHQWLQLRGVLLGFLDALAAYALRSFLLALDLGPPRNRGAPLLAAPARPSADDTPAPNAKSDSIVERLQLQRLRFRICRNESGVET
jgi:hypothetical protein